MFVEEGFRIRFANGETIDFYADNADQKDEWMRILSETVGKENTSGKGWTDMVLAKEKTERAASSAMAAAQAAQAQANNKPQKRPVPPARCSSRSVPSSPVKSGRPSVPARASPEKSPQHREERKQQDRRNLRGQVRSMMF